MSLADDYKVLERRYLAARQQIEKLQSNVRILKSSNDDLADRAEGLQKDAKEYKKAFEEIFIHRVGAAWDNIPPNERDSMDIKEKLEFYKREVSNTQAYMKKSFYEFEGSSRKELEEMKKKVDKLQRDLHQAEASLAEAKAAKPKQSNLSVPKDWYGGPKAENKEDNEEAPATAKAGMKKPVDTGFSFRKEGKSHQNPFLKKKAAGQEQEPPKLENREAEKAAILENLTKAEPAHQEQPLNQETPEGESKAKREPEPAPKATTEPRQKENKNTAKETGFNGRAKLEAMTREEKEQLAKKVAFLIKGKKPLSVAELHAIYVLGSTGVFTTQDILEQLGIEKPELGFKAISSTTLTKLFDKLLERELVCKQELKTAGKGRKPNIFFLTDFGKWFYFFRFKKDPVESMLYRISKDQKSVQHGADIMILVNMLTNIGYSCEQEFEEATDEGGSISDIVASKGRYSYYIEYEEGNYPEKGYEQKFRRINKRGRNVIFVTKDKKTTEKIEGFYRNFLAREENSEYRNNPALFLSFADFQGNKDPLGKFC